MFYRGVNQRALEYHTWVCLCLGMQVRNYVELGRGSAGVFREALGPGKVVTVDLDPNGLEGIPHFRADSHDPETVLKVLKLLGEIPEVVFIDAGHETADVRKDFELWWPNTKRIVGFHDILMPTVAPFWNTIRLGIPSIEIIAHDMDSANEWQRSSLHPDGNVPCGGIGVLFKGG